MQAVDSEDSLRLWSSAGFQGGRPLGPVSPISNRQGVHGPKRVWEVARRAGWKPAIRQVGNLRYKIAAVPRFFPIQATSQWLGRSAALASVPALSRGCGNSLAPKTGATARLSLIAAATLALFVGCSREEGGELHSQFFGRVEIVGTRGTGLGQLNKPRSLTVDLQDNLYVVDMTGRVQKFSPKGEYLLSWQMPQTDLGKPKGMTRDGSGNIVVVEPHYSRVNHFAPDGTLVTQWGRHGTNAGELGLPRSVAVNSKGDIFVSEYGATERIQRFSSNDHRLVATIGKFGTGNGEFNRAEGVAVDRDDRLYVADSCNHRLQVFSPDGKHLRTSGKPGSGSDELSYPYDVCVDADGRQFVCEFGNSRIHVFDSTGHSIEVIGGPGGAPGRFNNPWSIALDSHGNLYVADSGNHRVQKLVRKTVQGQFRQSARKAEDCRSPKASPLLGAHLIPQGSGLRQSSAAFRAWRGTAHDDPNGLALGAPWFTLP